MKITYLTVLLSVLLISCNYKSNPVDNFDPALQESATPGLKMEITWDVDIKPVFQKNCIACHSKFSDFEYVKTNFDGIFKRIDSGTMPMSGKLSKTVITKLAAWRDGKFVQSASAPSVDPTPVPTAIPEPVFDAQNVIEQQCTGCHQTGMAGVPNIYGLPVDYLAAEMNHYKEGRRQDGVMFTMNRIVKDFTDEQIQEIAQALNETDKCTATVNVDTHSDDVKRGATLFKLKCASCHAGAGTFAFPWLKGQDRQYLVQTMLSFIADESPRPAQQMKAYLRGLKEQDIRNIAAFLNSQSECNK